MPVLWLIPCLAELVRIKKLCMPRATWNEVGRPVLEMGDVSAFVCVCLCLVVFVCVLLCLVVFGCVWLCLVVFGCVWLCLFVCWLCLVVFVCVSMCCLRCVVGCRRCVGCCVVMTVQKRPKRNLYFQKNVPRENLSPLRF